MASLEQVKALLHSHNEGDDSRFQSIVMQMAASEARKGHNKVARELRELVDQAKRKEKKILPTSQVIPLKRPKGELSELLSVSYPKICLGDMVLNDSLSLRLQRVVKEQKNYNKLKSHGLTPRQKLLLTGPPGCGKTMTASVLAGELGLPLFVVRLDGLITKYMGESIAKLRLIFEEMQRSRAVYLFDEFDSIGTQRDYFNEVGEIRRVLNSFLMLLEQDQSSSLIIAATNHEKSLDYALFRRFDDLLEYQIPDETLLFEVFQRQLTTYSDKKIDFKLASESANGLSFSDVTQICQDAIKDMILHDRESITWENLKSIIDERFSFMKKL